MCHSLRRTHVPLLVCLSLSSATFSRGQCWNPCDYNCRCGPTIGWVTEWEILSCDGWAAPIECWDESICCPCEQVVDCRPDSSGCQAEVMTEQSQKHPTTESNQSAATEEEAPSPASETLPEVEQTFKTPSAPTDVPSRSETIPEKQGTPMPGPAEAGQAAGAEANPSESNATESTEKPAEEIPYTSPDLFTEPPPTDEPLPDTEPSTTKPADDSTEPESQNRSFEDLFGPDQPTDEESPPNSPTDESQPSQPEPQPPEGEQKKSLLDDLLGKGLFNRPSNVRSRLSHSGFRRWTNRIGQFSCQARLSKVTNQGVYLEQVDGTQRQLVYSQMSDADLQFVRREVAAKRAQLARDRATAQLAIEWPR